MNYQETLEFLYNQLPLYQRTGQAAYKSNLDNTLKLDKHLGHPHRHFKTIHVAGTNGKGSVSHMLAAVLQSAGYKTGLYTSPHLIDFRERIKVGREMIPRDFVVSFVGENKGMIEEVQPSFFEMTVAMAFDYFAKQNVDVAVVEVGLGGRLDSTNIISPDLSVITNISLDHTALLGNTIEAIAREKAGIIKENTPVVVGRRQPESAPVFVEIATDRRSSLTFAEDVYHVKATESKEEGGRQVIKIFSTSEPGQPETFRLPLAGFYQQENLVTVLTSVDILRQNGYHIPREALQAGVENVVKLTGLAGRWEKLGDKPLIICDTGHNKDGLQRVVSQLKTLKYKTLHFILGVVNDKDLDSILVILPPQARYYFTRADIPRALDQELLKAGAQRYGLRGDTYKTVASALAAAEKNSELEDMIFVGGSTFVVAEAMQNKIK